MTSIVSSNNTRKATVLTVEAGAANTQATLVAAHVAWLREKRAAAYEETLADLLQRQDSRLYKWAMLDESAARKQMNRLFGDVDSPEWAARQGRLHAMRRTPF